MSKPRGAQMSMVCEGMLPDETNEGNIADVFAVWVERIADVNAAIAAHNQKGEMQ